VLYDGESQLLLRVLFSAWTIIDHQILISQDNGRCPYFLLLMTSACKARLQEEREKREGMRKHDRYQSETNISCVMSAVRISRC
jgi:hypothetical protein